MKKEKMTMFNPPHPGLLISEVMETMEINAADLAKALKVPVSTITCVLNGSVNITDDIALRIEKILGIDALLLLDMQVAYTRSRSGNFAKRA